MKYLIVVLLASMAAVCVAEGEEREMLGVRTTPDRAAQCRKEGCGLYTPAEVKELFRQGRAEALRDVARALDTHGCLKDQKA